MHEIFSRIEKAAPRLREAHQEAEDLGRLPDATAADLREIGVIRMLQTEEFGGYEADPGDFLDAVMRIAAVNGPAGWVSGVVGLHAWEVSQMPIEVQKQVWGEDPDVWVASPYTPIGRAVPTDGGYIFSGKWSFSSGTDHCSWIYLGGLRVLADGSTDTHENALHFLLPRKDYEIVEGSWDVVGLAGTGSKDIVVDEVFVPHERVVALNDLFHGVQADRVGRGGQLYQMPYSAMFPGAITAATIGLAMGALDAFTEYESARVISRRGAASRNVFHLATLAEAASDIEASRLQVLDDLRRVRDIVAADEEVSLQQRILLRRNQVRASRRAVDAVDALFRHAGGNALRRDQRMQRFWRDCHAALNHVSNVGEPVYEGWGMQFFGHDVTGGLRVGPAHRVEHA
ncbi:hypothetical protein [Nocardia higoensis]|uniref:hypothetical protein n=1 Tax=Nocardia higoensis TaxID=228599 RepID=UPI00031C7AC1|nr:hypothetical protein [Nocardia higoensis]